MAAVLDIKELNVTFELPRRQVHAVADLNLTLEQGETLAVVGESGSGKSQAFLAVMGLLARNGWATGHAIIGNVDLLALSPRELDRHRGQDVSMIFQDPMTSLNPSLRIDKQLAEVLVTHKGLSWEQSTRRAIEMLDRVGIPEPVKRARSYPHELSGGMRQRVMIAMALLCQPKVLIADEPTTALDVTVQAQMLDLFAELTDDFGTSLVLITHDLGVVAGVADRMMVMYAGRAVEVGSVDELFYDPRHPYTFGLLHSTTHVEKTGDRLAPIKGLPPSLEHLPSGCAFHPRCAFKMDRCVVERPELIRREHNRLSACFFEGEMARADLEATEA
jgi:oligopeptide transport system ATP-binding protein